MDDAAHERAVAARFAPQLDAFVECAARYCLMIEDWYIDPLAEQFIHELLFRLEPMHPELHRLAIHLPETHEWFQNIDKDEADDTSSRARPVISDDDRARSALTARGLDQPARGLRRTLERRLGPLAFGPEVFDPYFESFGSTISGVEPIIRSLGDDLASVYGWAHKAIQIEKPPEPDATMSRWFDARLNFDMDIGHHLIGAMRSLHAILRWHGEDDLMPLPTDRPWLS